MCFICDSWANGGGQSSGLGGTVPGSSAGLSFAGPPGANDPQLYVRSPNQWDNRPGRTFTWSNATLRFSGDGRQPDLQYYMNADQVALVRRAFEVWEQVANVNFREVSDSASTDIRIGLRDIDGSGGTLGYERGWSRGGVKTATAIAFDTADSGLTSSSARTNFLWIAVHEIGHALGLGHSSERDSIMYARRNPQTTSLHSDDINGIQALFGARSGPRPRPVPPQWPPETPINLGNLTSLSSFRTRTGTVHPTSDDIDLYRFTLTNTRTIRIELRNLSADADLYLHDASGNRIAGSTLSGTAVDSIVRSLGAGTYYIRVDAHAGGTIGYQLRYGNESGPQPRPPSSGGTRATAVNLGNLTSASTFRTRSGTVNQVTNDDDYYRFTLSGSRRMRIELRNLGADADLYLESSSGQVIRSSARSGTAADSIVHWLGAGTYYIRVDAFASGTIGYQLRFRSEGTGNGTTRATAVNLGNLTSASTFRTRSGTVNQVTNDDDYYRFTLSGSRRMRIELRNLGADADLYLESSSGQVIRSSLRSGTTAESILQTLGAGTYYIRVDAFAGGNIGYQLRFRSEGTGSGTTRATAVNLGNLTSASAFRTRSGTVNRVTNDDDYYRFTLSGSRRMRIELRNLGADADLYLESSSGQVIRSSLRSGTAAESILQTLGAGTYYIRVDAFAGGNIGYQLRFRSEGTGSGTTRATAVNLGDLTSADTFRRRSGTVNRATNDDDYYRFTLSGRRFAYFQIGRLSGDADLFLEDASGRVIASSRRGGTALDSVVGALGAGTYYIRVDAFAGGNISYRLSYSTDGGNEVGNLTNTTETWTGSVNGTSDELDLFRFNLTATRTMRFELYNLSADADLYLLDGSGSQVTSSRRAGTLTDSITRTLGAGTYYILVDAATSGTARYSLRFSRSLAVSSPETRPTTSLSAATQPLWRDDATSPIASVIPRDEARRFEGTAGGTLAA